MLSWGVTCLLHSPAAAVVYAEVRWAQQSKHAGRKIRSSCSPSGAAHLFAHRCLSNVYRAWPSALSSPWLQQLDSCVVAANHCMLQGDERDVLPWLYPAPRLEPLPLEGPDPEGLARAAELGRVLRQAAEVRSGCASARRTRSYCCASCSAEPHAGLLASRTRSPPDPRLYSGGPRLTFQVALSWASATSLRG